MPLSSSSPASRESSSAMRCSSAASSAAIAASCAGPECQRTSALLRVNFCEAAQLIMTEQLWIHGHNIWLQVHMAGGKMSSAAWQNHVLPKYTLL